MDFKKNLEFKNLKYKTIILNTNESEFSLHPLKTKKLDNKKKLIKSTFLNLGGTVISFSWCPEELGRGNILAISTSDSETNVLEKHPNKIGFIQFWEFDQFESKTEFLFALKHNFDFMWDMSWVVGESKESILSLCDRNLVNNCEFLITIGSDCEIYIFSVFNGNNLSLNHPIMKLNGNELLFHRFKWHKGSLLAASLLGCLVLWDFSLLKKNSNSKLNKLKFVNFNENLINFDYILKWQAHKFPHMVNWIDWNPKNDFYVLSCGNDRNLKIWNLKLIDHPINTFSFSTVINFGFWVSETKIILTLETRQINGIKLLNIDNGNSELLFTSKLCDKNANIINGMHFLKLKNSNSNYCYFILTGDEYGLVYLHSMEIGAFSDEKFCKHEIQLINQIYSKNNKINVLGPFERFTKKKKTKANKIKSTYEQKICLKNFKNEKDNLNDFYRKNSINNVILKEGLNKIDILFYSRNGLLVYVSKELDN